MNAPKELKYTKTHEWIRVEGNLIIVGITDFAQEQLSDLTYVELPTVGDNVEAQSEMVVLESVKAAADVYAPVSGIIKEINESLNDDPESVNTDPYGAGWLFKLEPANMADLEGLLSVEQYKEMLPEG